MQQVSGSTAFAGITTYASNPAYNARGTLTALSYGNGVQMNISGFNNKLQATDFEVKKGTDSYIKKVYKFYEDGSLKFIDDQLSDTFDRSYKYDFAGRTIEAKAGVAARGGTSTDPNKLDQPYTMSYKHDAFGHITNKTGYYYSSYDTNSYSFNANDRNQAWGYDVEGNITYDDDASYEIDAAGRVVKTGTRDYDNPGQFSFYTADYFNGDGQLEKRIRNVGSTTPPEMKNYYIRSSVLGKVISETDATGKKLNTYVPANGTTLATQQLQTYNGTTSEYLTFNHTDASGTGAQETNSSGALTGNTTYNRTGEYTPLGRNIADAGQYITLNTADPYAADTGGVILFGSEGGYRPGSNTYTVDGLVVPEAYFIDTVINSGDIGGAFGLLEIAVRMSAPHYTVYDSYGIPEYSGTDWGQARNTAYRTETFFAVRTLNTSWSAIASLATQTQRQNQPQPTFLGFESDKKKRIEDILKSSILNSATCTKAFQEAGVETVADQIKNGLTILYSTFVVNSNNDKQWVPEGDTQLASGMRAIITPIFSHTNDVTFPGPYTDGRRYLTLTGRAFDQTDDYLDVSFVHSLIHSGGKKGKNYYFTGLYTDSIYNGKTGMETTPARPIYGPINGSTLRGDLEWMGEKYNKIITACTSKGSKVGPARGQ